MGIVEENPEIQRFADYTPEMYKRIQRDESLKGI